MYRNLKAEMARCNVKRSDIAKLLRVRYATVVDRLSGKYRFYFDEAMKIKKAFFPNLSIEYLFDSDECELLERKARTNKVV